MSDKVLDKIEVVDFSAVPDEEDGKTAYEMRAEFTLLMEKERVERERLGGLLNGCGRGGGKASQFEFAARAILATGCSARAAKENLLVGARLFCRPNCTTSLRVKCQASVGFGTNGRD